MLNKNKTSYKLGNETEIIIRNKETGEEVIRTTAIITDIKKGLSNDK